MFNELEISPQEMLNYIAELFIRNMKALDTIALLKEQLKQIDEIRRQAEKAQEERNSAVLLANKYEAQIHTLNAKVAEYENTIKTLTEKINTLEGIIATYESTDKGKKGNKK